MSSADSIDYLPLSSSQNQMHRDDSSSLNNGSASSLGSTGKHSFSFAKLRRNGAKNKDAASSSRPSTANSSNEEINSVKSFLYPTRATQPQPHQAHQSRQQTPVPAHSDAPPPAAASPPGYLSPGPSSSASPFLNKHSATVGRASGSSLAGHTAQDGLTQVFGGGSGAASLGPSSSAASARVLSSTNGIPPPKPPKPKPSLLAAFPRSDNATPGVSISAPTSANLDSRHPIDGASRNLLSLPGQAGAAQESAAISIYRNISHSRSQEAVAEARLDAEALRASAGTPMPPPRRLNQQRVGLAGAGAAGSPAYSAYSSSAMGRSTSGGAGGVVGALGHVGQFGAAMGRKGWDFMKTLQTSNTAATSGRNGTYASAYRAGGAGASSASSLAAAAENEPTRQWLLLLEAPESSRAASLRGPGEVFGASLQDAVLRSRLSSISTDNVRAEDHLGVPDLGQKFSANFLDSPAPRRVPRSPARALVSPWIATRRATCICRGSWCAASRAWSAGVRRKKASTASAAVAATRPNCAPTLPIHVMICASTRSARRTWTSTRCAACSRAICASCPKRSSRPRTPHRWTRRWRACLRASTRRRLQPKCRAQRQARRARHVRRRSLSSTSPRS